ncbi:hypothetical protein DPMN_182580 [Dreissena polymorpha]|uniref:Uncharacterized protein n=1 Tax=Dreissena polymorpha TaxID=45954 RepID=A0A9D4DFR9_DREPO|nr:hypothetical protein DPMN_182580 [Dreissena polymorpha]
MVQKGADMQAVLDSVSIPGSIVKKVQEYSQQRMSYCMLSHIIAGCASIAGSMVRLGQAYRQWWTFTIEQSMSSTLMFYWYVLSLNLFI